MIRFVRYSLLAVLISQMAAALSVRTLAFKLPESPLEIEVTSPLLKDPVKLEATAPSFGIPVDLPPGNYTAKCPKMPVPIQFSLPDSKTVTKYILVVVSSNSGEWSIFPIPDDVTTFSNGDFFFINATPTDIGITLSKEKILLGSRLTATMKMPAADPDFKFDQFPVEMKTVLNGKMMTINSGFWRRLPKVRTLVLIFVDPATQRYRTMTLGKIDEEDEKKEDEKKPE